MKNKNLGPGLFFFVNGEFLFHSCPLAQGEPYGDFLNYPHSHDYVWRRNYAKAYGVDFDYFPRGRIVYRKSDDAYLIYYDRCIEGVIGKVAERYAGEKYILSYDEHYQCHSCNDGYAE